MRRRRPRTPARWSLAAVKPPSDFEMFRTAAAGSLQRCAAP